MATLQIIKSSLDYFTFVLNDDVNKSIIDNAPNLTIFENGALCHFKTKNGASLFRDQNISYTDITYTNASGTSFTFASVGELMQKLISEEFFKGLNQGTGSGASRFDELLDTFEYYGNDGKVPVIDTAQLKLIPIEFFNFDKFTQLNDVAISELIADKILSVELVGGVPKVVLSDKPDTTQQLVNAMGWLDYNDLATQTTPLTLVANVDKKLTNDTLGAFTDKTQAPFGVNNIWNESTNQFNFQQLTIGDTLDIRIDVTVTTTAVNQRVKVFLRLAVGSPSQYDLPIADILYKTATSYQIVETQNIYIGSANFKDYPTEIYIVSDSSATCVVGGWYTRILRKSVNLVTFEITEDNTADHYRGLWNASTNTPTLTNGFGQVGDWYVVSVAGGGYLVGDIVAYDGSVYYKKVNNNQMQAKNTQIFRWNGTNWSTATLNNYYYISFSGAIEGLQTTINASMNGRNKGLFITPFNCKIKRVLFVEAGSGTYTGNFVVASGMPNYGGTWNNGYSSITTHLIQAISSVGANQNKYEMLVTDNITVPKGYVISPMLVFSAQQSTSKTGIEISIEIEEV